MMSFVTGSRKYGKPRPDSDIDLVCLVSPEDLRLLADQNENRAAANHHHDYPDGQVALRFGKLNLICVSDLDDYDDWKEGTETLESVKPVSREKAVGVFEGLRQATRLRRASLEARQSVPVAPDGLGDLEF